MKRSALEYFCCPKCRGTKLKLENAVPAADCSIAAVEEVVSGTLVCSGCRMEFPINDNVPRFVPDSYYAGSFGYQWNKHRRTQLDSVCGLPLSRDRLFAASGWPTNLKGEKILEAGSGAGRLTEVLLNTGARIFSFDLSEAVDANWENNGDKPNLNPHFPNEPLI